MYILMDFGNSLESKSVGLVKTILITGESRTHVHLSSYETVYYVRTS